MGLRYTGVCYSGVVPYIGLKDIDIDIQVD